MTQETEEKASTDLEGVLAALTSNDRFLVVAHENPDGDALGSMLAMALGLRALGKDALMYLSGYRPACRPSSGSCALDEVLREPPEDISERVLVAVDCANARRIGQDPAILDHAKAVVDVDHHHDNTRFGTTNLIVADASSTAEIVRDLLWELGVRLTPDIAEALYVGSSPTRAASSTRTRRRSRSGSRRSSSRPAPTSTASSATSTRRCSSRS